MSRVAFLLIGSLAVAAGRAAGSDLLARTPSRLRRLDGLRVHYKSLGELPGRHRLIGN